MLQRLLAASVAEALSDTPVVLLNGARQTGKTTLAHSFASKPGGAERVYINLDDATVADAARSDPAGFLKALKGPAILDEVQHVPELFPAIKLLVDEVRLTGANAAGRFLLTGSANVLLLPKLSESLAGRMELLTLWPLAQAEIEGVQPDAGGGLVDVLFGDAAFQERFRAGGTLACDRDDVIARLLRGGYPEAISRKTEARRRAWFGTYITTILQRDVRDLARIDGLAGMPRLLTLLASRSAGLLNLADVSRGVSLPHSTLQRYLTLLEATFLVQLLPAWAGGTAKRLARAPKVILNDTGLTASLLGADKNQLLANDFLLGSLMETFTATEFYKLASWSHLRPQLFHYRTGAGEEVDLVLEDASGRVVGIETKCRATVTSADFRGLRNLAEVAGSRFQRGIVLYSGETIVPLGSNLWAVPISALWV